MPMCDAYIPLGALELEVERGLVARVTEILVDHEMRRIRDLMEDPDAVKASLRRAQSIAWTFVHRTETYVAGAPTQLPYYRFVASVPEGQMDDEFVPAINQDIMQAVIDAEGGKYPHPERRVWVIAHEVPDGLWGSGGRQLHLKQIVDFVAPGWGEVAAKRFAEKRREAATT